MAALLYCLGVYCMVTIRTSNNGRRRITRVGCCVRPNRITATAGQTPHAPSTRRCCFPEHTSLLLAGDTRNCGFPAAYVAVASRQHASLLLPGDTRYCCFPAAHVAVASRWHTSLVLPGSTRRCCFPAAHVAGASRQHMSMLLLSSTRRCCFPAAHVAVASR